MPRYERPVDLTDAGCRIVGTLMVELPQPPAPPRPAALGIDCSDGNLADNLKRFPRLDYMRVFHGTKWPSWTGGRIPLIPAHVLVHASCDGPWNPAEFEAWCASATRDVLATWKHEPMKKVTAAEYVKASTEMALIAARYPRILTTGPILTAAWLRNNPANAWRQWCYDGLGFFGCDVYNDHATRYRSASEKFDPVADIADQLGVRDIYPEWGTALVAGDREGRAQTVRDDTAWFRSRAQTAPKPSVDIPLCAGWWNIDNSGTELEPGDPGEATYRTLVDQQVA